MLSPARLQRDGEMIAAEQQAAKEDRPSSRRTMIVYKRIHSLPETHPDGTIDWETELAGFKQLAYPDYYLKPFHSIPGGWLSRKAALENRRAMQAIYQDAHPRSCLGMRDELAKFVPETAEYVVDLGAGDGDGAAATARRLPGATVVAVECSPTMIVAGRHQNPGVHNMRFQHALAEASGIPSAVADSVTITLVLHECSDEGKRAILAEALRILRPGGTLVLSDTPQDDLGTFRGFLEPHKDAWTRFSPEQLLAEIGFEGAKMVAVLGAPVRTAAEHRAAQTAGTTDNRLFVVRAQKRHQRL